MNWKDTLAKVAPTLAGALGGPLTGVAVKLGLDAIGIKASGEPEHDQDVLEQAVASGSPDGSPRNDHGAIRATGRR